MDQSVSVVGRDVEPGGRLLAFAARLRRQHVRQATLAAAARALLLLSAPSILIAWALPAHRAATLLALVSALLLVAAFAWVRARAPRGAALLLAGDGAPTGSIAVVGDELATWLERRLDAAADAPMVQWLGRDVEARLPGLPADAIAGAGRRGLGRWRRLVPFVGLLLLVWLVAEWLAPPWPGVLSGRARDLPGPAASGPGDGSGGGNGGGGIEQPQSPDPQPDEGKQQPAAAQPQEPPGPAPTPPEPEAPAPLLELPEQQRFVVPEFVGDGPTRRARVHAAEVERSGAVSRPRPTGAGGNDESPSPPPPTAESFERAAEAAQRARHVPDEERPMVRRFFELLREAAK